MAIPVVVPVPQDRLDDLQLVWRALYEHHTALTPHLRDREVPCEWNRCIHGLRADMR